MLTLGYTLALGNREFTSQVVRLRCERAVAPGVGVLRAHLPYRGDLPAAVGDDVRLDLDSGEQQETVFTGVVVALRHSRFGVEVVAGDASWQLAQHRPGTSFEGQHAADVITALADAAGVSVGAVETGPLLPSYLADGATTGWEHVARLAAWSAATALVTADGELTVAAPDPATPTHALKWGREVLDVVGAESGAPPSAVSFASEGPGPADDKPGAFRFTASSAAPAAPVAVRYRPGLRADDLAADATTDWLTREAARRTPVQLQAFLLPAVAPGDVLEIQEAPYPVPLLQVRRVQHRLDRRGGRTHIAAWGAPSEDLLGSLLASALGAVAGAVGGLL